MNSPPSGFQWDEEKNRSNIVKHGIDFFDAVRIFEQPTLDAIDDRTDYGETRTNSIGEQGKKYYLNVTHTDRNGETRLISARRASTHERDLFRQFQKNLRHAVSKSQRDRSSRNQGKNRDDDRER